MSELQKDLPSPVVLTLTEAALTAHCSTAKLLSFGAEGKIKIYVDVPADLIAFDVDYNTLRLAEDPLSEWQRNTLRGMLAGYAPLEMRNVKGLLLSRIDCNAIVQQGSGLYGQSIFSEAWGIDPSGCLSSIRPSVSKKARLGRSGKPSVFGRMFATYAKSQLRDVLDLEGDSTPEPIVIHTAKLRIFSKDLQLFLSSNLVYKNVLLRSVAEVVQSDSLVKPIRSRVEHDVIREAMRRAQPFTDAGKVWSALVQMASSKPPYPGTVSHHPRQGVEVVGGSGNIYLTRKSLSDRVRRMKAQIASI